MFLPLRHFCGQADMNQRTYTQDAYKLDLATKLSGKKDASIKQPTLKNTITGGV